MSSETIPTDYLHEGRKSDNVSIINSLYHPLFFFLNLSKVFYGHECSRFPTLSVKNKNFSEDILYFIFVIGKRPYKSS